MEAALTRTRRWMWVTGAMNLALLALLATKLGRPHDHIQARLLFGYELLYFTCLVAYGLQLRRGAALEPVTWGLLVLWCADWLASGVVALPYGSAPVTLATLMLTVAYKAWGVWVLGRLLSSWTGSVAETPQRTRLLALGQVLVAILGLAVAGQARREQEEHRELELECRSRLMGWHSAQMTRYDERHDYDATLATPPEPAPGARPHSQMLTWDQPGLPHLTGDVAIGLTGVCPDCQIAALCVSQLESAPGDAWSVSTRERLGPHGVIVRGQVADERTGLPRYELLW